MSEKVPIPIMIRGRGRGGRGFISRGSAPRGSARGSTRGRGLRALRGLSITPPPSESTGRGFEIAPNGDGTVITSESKQPAEELEELAWEWKVQKWVEKEEERGKQNKAEKLVDQPQVEARMQERERQRKEIEVEEQQKFNLKVEKLVALVNQPRDGDMNRMVETRPSAAFGHVFSGELDISISPTPEPIPLRTLVEAGDMIIDATSSSTSKVLVRYQVASQVLWSASRVFRRMFGPESQFKEAVDVRRAERGYGPAVIPLHDEPEVLELILNTLHHRNDKLPDTIPFERMVEVAVISDKYELHCALRFVAEMWSRSLWSIDAGYEDWLLISWVFGYEDKFTKISEELIMRSEWKDGVGLVFGEGDWRSMLSDATPEAVTSKIAELRGAHVNRLREGIEKPKVDRCEAHCRPLICGFAEEGCDALQLGHLIQTMSKLGFDKDETWCQSVRSISATVDDIEILCFTGCNCCVDSHKECSWVHGFKTHVQDTVLGIRGLKFTDFPSRCMPHKRVLINHVFVSE